MATVLDVARYIVKLHGEMSAMKLQKLVYYAQAWALVWDEEPIFKEKIRAWANGPVVRELYDWHKGKFSVSTPPPGDIRKLTDDEKETIEVVVDYYGKKSGAELSALTHREAPWKDAREGLVDGARSNREIKLSSMAEYYGSLL